MHRKLNIKVPPETLESLSASKQKIAKELNKTIHKNHPNKRNLPDRILEVSDSDVQEHLEVNFCILYTQWARPVTLPNGTTYPITTASKKERLDRVGETSNLLARIDAKKNNVLQSNLMIKQRLFRT